LKSITKTDSRKPKQDEAYYVLNGYVMSIPSLSSPKGKEGPAVEPRFLRWKF
jgi:hypothetical protein